MIDAPNLFCLMLRDHKTLQLNIPVINHLHAAVEWILRAYKMAGDGGISKGYSLLRGRWSPSYPETTGYTVPTLLNAAAVLDRSELREVAIRMADYLLDHANEDGAVVHWQDRRQYDPIVFDTGQVIFGWLAAFTYTQNEIYLSAARKAGHWLVSIQDPTGCWIRGQYLDVVKVIDTRVAWSLIELAKVCNQDIFYESARKNLDWALAQQNEKGWFYHCSFREEVPPITHTLAYTAEGLFESGIHFNEERYSRAAQLTLRALLAKVKPDGSLPGAFNHDWTPALRSSCLTGNCQAARLWLRLYELDGQKETLQPARQVLAFVAGLQPMEEFRKEIYGGISGSYPIYGEYERFQFPNWAAKFFIDALLQLDFIERRNNGLIYVG